MALPLPAMGSSVMDILASLLVLSLLGAYGPPPGQVASAEVAATLEDGPHVIWDGSTARVLRVSGGRLQETRLEKPWMLPLAGLPPLRLDPAGPPPPQARWALPGRVAAVSDLHGHLDACVALLQAQGILDRQRRWSFGKGHLVVVGDVVDRGTQETEALWLLRSLEVQALKAGGRVHVLMGNHETFALRGVQSYQHPKYRALRAGPLAAEAGALYGPRSELGRWLRMRPAMVRLGDFLFCHGGPSPALVREGHTLEGLNEAFRRQVLQEGRPSLLGPEGPVWYRGLIPGAGEGPDATDAEVKTLLGALGVRAVVVGHSTLERVGSFHGGRVFGVDAGFKDGRPGEVWLWEGGRTRRGLADGSRVDLP